MATSRPITWQVSDVIQWFKKRELVVNEKFQRHSVWTPQAKTYLIDTILQELPLPKIYIRSILDAKRQSSIREVIDGQQRIRTICEFANDEFTLSARSELFEGKKYSTLSIEEQEKFLGYILTVEHLLNAADDDVIDIFARLNSYTVSLNQAEMRHAKFQTEFKFSVRKCAQKHRDFIEKYNIFSVRQRFRMADDEFFAQVYQLLHDGVVDGGQASITRFYTAMTDEVFDKKLDKKYRTIVDEVIAYFNSNLQGFLNGSYGKHYQILMMIAAYVFQRYGLPKGAIEELPKKSGLDTINNIVSKLEQLERALDSEDKLVKKFAEASSSSTHRISSRSVRFETFCLIFGK